MPEFADFTFAEKFYMGLANVERIFIAQLDPVYCVVAAVLVLLVYRKTGDYRKTLLAGIPTLLLFGQAVVRVSHPSLKKVFVRPEQTTHWDWHALVTYMPLVFLVLSVWGILYALWQLDGVFTGRRFCHGGGYGIFTDNLRIGKPAVPLSVFCADLCVRGCRVEHGRHEDRLEDRQCRCSAENAGV